MKPAIFLDRDGTVIVDKGYIKDPAHVELIPRAAEGVKRMNRLGLPVILCSNQSGVARGHFTEDDLKAVHGRMVELLAQQEARVDAYYYCIHYAEGTVRSFAVDCDCRKPKPGLLRRAIQDHGIDPSRSFMIGDTLRDMTAGRAVGARTLMVLTGPVQPVGVQEMQQADFIVYDLTEAAHWIEVSM